MAGYEASSSSQSSPIIYRPRKTYGRPRPQPTFDADSSLSQDNHDTLSSDFSGDISILRTDDEYPPTSDEGDASTSFDTRLDDASDEDDSPFQFDWKKKLQAMDQDDMDFSHVQIDSNELPDEAAPPAANDRGVTASDGGANAGLSTDIESHRAETHVSTSPNVTLASLPSPQRLSAHSTKGHRGRDAPSSVSPRSPLSDAPRLFTPTSPISSQSTPPTSLVAKSKGKARADSPSPSNGSDELSVPRLAKGRSQRTDRESKSKGKSKAPRKKALSKKELAEAKKSTARMLANQAVSLPRAEPKQLTLQRLFEKVGHGLGLVSASAPTTQSLPPSDPDPIQPFSSSPGSAFGIDLRDEDQSSVKFRDGTPSKSSGPAFSKNGLLAPASPSLAGIPILATSDDDEEMPNIDTLLQEDERKREGTSSRLMELKLRALEEQQHHPLNLDEESDSDLEIVRYDAKSEGGILKPKGHISAGKKKHLAFVGPLRPAASSSKARKASKDNDTSLRPYDLDKMLLQNAQEQAEKLTKVKEEEWQRRGGRVNNWSTLDQSNVEAAKMERLGGIVAKALHRSEDQGGDDKEGSDQSDEDFTPGGEELVLSGEEDEELLASDRHGSPTSDRESPYADDENDDEEMPVLHRKVRPRAIAVVQSDDEDELSPRTSAAPLQSLTLPVPQRNSLNHRGSLSSMDERTEEETDKENDERLKFDRGEDKENSVILNSSLTIRSPSLSSGGILSFNERIGLTSSNPSSSRIPLQLTLSEGSRSPLKEIPRDDDDGDDPFVISPTPSRRFNDRLKAMSDHDPSEAFVSEVEVKALEFSFDEGPASKKPALDFADATQDVPAGVKVLSPQKLGMFSSWGDSDFMTAPQAVKGLDALRAQGSKHDLALTLDAGLQPVFEVAGTLLQRAEHIFEKEQEGLAEDFNEENAPPEELYVNRNGFLTQTRPDVMTPESSRFNSSPFTSATQLTTRKGLLSTIKRRPVQELTFDDLETVDEIEPLMRLKKRRASPSQNAEPSRSPSPSPSKPRNAFAALKHWNPHDHAPKARAPIDPTVSAFIEGEAEESDEDDQFGFGARRKKDDEEEEEGEDPDQTLAELVDDTELDERARNEAAVLEKVREHQELDDKAIEKLHTEAVQGKFRVKRRDRGIGFDSDDEDDEDDEARHLRRRMNKKRKIQDDSLDQLAKHEETRAFVEAYHADIVDDDDEFAHMREVDDMTVVNDGSQEAEDEGREVVSAAAVRMELRKAAAEDIEHSVFNPTDLAWMENSDNEEGPSVKEVELPKARTASRAAKGPSDWDNDFQHAHASKDDEQSIARLQRWATSERSSRSAIGRGSASGGSAVTGHGKKIAAGAPRNNSQRSKARPGPAETGKAVKSASMLSVISSSKRSKFEKK